MRAFVAAMRLPGSVVCLGGVLVVLALTGFVPTHAGDGPGGPPSIDSLDLRLASGELEVSFRLSDAFDERILAKLDSGLEVVFTHKVQARRKRGLWFDRTVAAKKVETSAVLDGLTRQYTLRRKVNGGLVDNLTTSDVDEMRTFMTFTDGLVLELPAKMPLDGRTEVRVRSTLETRFFLFFPYAYQTEWARLRLNVAAAVKDGDGE